MKKFSGIVLIVAIALAAPSAVGAAGKKKYEGVFEAGGTNSFTLKKTNNGKKVMNYEWASFPLACDGGPQTSTNGLNFGVKVKKGEFEAVATPSTAEKVKLTLKGEFTGPTSAEGTMRIAGSRVPVDGGGKDSCDSSKIRWTAAKVVALAKAGSRSRSPWAIPR
jgi:hypothetical protein